MCHDFGAFLEIYREEGAVEARSRVSVWRRENFIDVTQYALMMSYLERRSGNIVSSIDVLSKAIDEGGEGSALNISLAQDFIQQDKFDKAVLCCDVVIRDTDNQIAYRFLSTAFLLKSYAFLNLGNLEGAETLLQFIRPDLSVNIKGERKTVITLLEDKDKYKL